MERCDAQDGREVGRSVGRSVRDGEIDGAAAEPSGRGGLRLSRLFPVSISAAAASSEGIW